MKWRWPTPGRGAWPTAFGSIRKFVSLTLAVTVDPRAAPLCGVLNDTFDPGDVGGGGAELTGAVLSELLDELLPPQPDRAAAAMRMAVAVRVMASPRCPFAPRRRIPPDSTGPR